MLKTNTLLLSFLFSSFIGYSQINLNQGLVGFFKLDNNTADSSISALPGTGVSITPVSGFKNNPNTAYSFNGSSSYIDCGVNNRTITNTVVISLWVNTITTIGHEFLVEKYDWQNDRGFYLAIKDGYPYIGVRNTSGYGVFTWNDSPEVLVNNGQWHHLLAEISNNSIQFWIDGVLDADTSLNASNPDLTTLVPLSIGYYSIGSAQGNHNYFKGSLDQIRIYNRVLTADEIAYLSTENTITGVKNVEFSENVSVYPNPTNGVFNIKSSKPISIVEVYNTTGQLMKVKGISTLTYDISSLTNGVYFIKLISQENTIISVQKIVKR